MNGNGLLGRIGIHIKTEKNRVVFQNLSDAMDKQDEYKLHDSLKEKLEDIKSSPSEEPKVNDAILLAIKEIEELTKEDAFMNNIQEYRVDGLISIATSVLEDDELEDMYKNGVSMEDFAEFGRLVEEKVRGFKYIDDEKGYIFKEPESHNDIKLLSFKDAMSIRKKIREISSMQDKVEKKFREAQNVLDSTDEDFDKKRSKNIDKKIAEAKEISKKVKDKAESLNDFAFKCSGLDKEELTDWEFDMAIAKMKEMADGTYTPKEGKN